MKRVPVVLGGAIASLLVSAQAHGALLQGEILLEVGQPVAGAGASDVMFFGSPWIEGDGTPVLTGELEDGTGFVVRDGVVVWLSSDDAQLDGASTHEATTNADGGFAVETDYAGGPAIWTDAGLLAATDVSTPGIGVGPAGVWPSNPQLAADGGLHWMYRTASQRWIMHSPSGLPGDATVVITNGDPVGSFVVDSDSDALLRYQASPNGQHLIILAELDNDGSDRDWIVVDGVPVAGQFQDANGDEDWFVFTDFTVDDTGRYAVSGLFTGGAPGAVVVDGDQTIMEGDTVGGLLLAEPSEASAVSLDGQGRVISAWEHPAGTSLVVSCDADDLVGSARVLVSDGDELDLDGDQSADATVDAVFDSILWTTRFLGPDGYVLAALVVDGASSVVRLGPVCCDGADCCGNGVLEPDEVCDDGDADAGDDCTTECLLPVCGDGYVHADTEECDDGNDDDDDACANDCTLNPVDPSTTGSDDDGGSGETSDTGGGDDDGGSSGEGTTTGDDPEPGSSGGDGGDDGGPAGTTGNADTDTDGDASSDDSGGTGCGCATTPPSPEAFAFAWLLLVATRRSSGGGRAGRSGSGSRRGRSP